MKSRQGWVLSRKGEHPFGSSVTLAVIIPSKRVTNKAVDDVVRELHLKEYGRAWPNKPIWRGGTDPLLLTLKTPVCTYVLTRVDVYG